MKEKENKRINKKNWEIKILLFFFIFTIIGSVFTESIFADDKGETKNKDVQIRVIVNNPNFPGPTPPNTNTGSSGKKGKKGYVCKDSKAFNFSNSGLHDQSLCIYLKKDNDFIIDNGEKEYVFEEDKNIDLDSDSSDYVIKKQPSKDGIYLDDTKIISDYENNLIRLWLDTYENKIFQDQEVKLNMILSTISKKEIDLKNNIVDAYLIIKNDKGEILEKQDLFDKEKNIDFLNLKNIKKLHFGNFIKVTREFFVNNKPGKYTIGVSVVLSPKFLDLEKKFQDKYLIEVNSNDIDIEVLEKEKKITFWENNLWTVMAGFAMVALGLIWWWIILFFRRRLYRLITKFVLNNKELIIDLEKENSVIINDLDNFIKPKMFKLVSKNKILKTLRKVLKNEVK